MLKHKNKPGTYLPTLAHQCYADLLTQFSSKFNPSDTHLVQTALPGLAVPQVPKPQAEASSMVSSWAPGRMRGIWHRPSACFLGRCCWRRQQGRQGWRACRAWQQHSPQPCGWLDDQEPNLSLRFFSPTISYPSQSALANLYFLLLPLPLIHVTLPLYFPGSHPFFFSLHVLMSWARTRELLENRSLLG